MILYFCLNCERPHEECLCVSLPPWAYQARLICDFCHEPDTDTNHGERRKFAGMDCCYDCARSLALCGVEAPIVEILNPVT